MEIPRYKVENLIRHLERIVANCHAGPCDTRTANALRLARKDLADLRRYSGNSSKKQK